MLSQWVSSGYQDRAPLITKEPAYDVVGVGALNLDYIVSTPAHAGSIMAALSGALPKLDPPLAWNTERLAEEHPVRLPSEAISPDDVTVSLGGSAFNAISALASMKLGLRLGYVGITGKMPEGAPSFIDQLAAAGIDRSYVWRDESRPTGVCLSVMEHGEPTMITHPGVNVGMADYLTAEFEPIVE